jgi:hypothetical protein
MSVLRSIRIQYVRDAASAAKAKVYGGGSTAVSDRKGLMRATNHPYFVRRPRGDRIPRRTASVKVRSLPIRHPLSGDVSHIVDLKRRGFMGSGRIRHVAPDKKPRICPPCGFLPLSLTWDSQLTPIAVSQRPSPGHPLQSLFVRFNRPPNAVFICPKSASINTFDNIAWFDAMVTESHRSFR